MNNQKKSENNPKKSGGAMPGCMIIFLPILLVWSWLQSVFGYGPDEKGDKK
jgi:hypothetical protein